MSQSGTTDLDSANITGTVTVTGPVEVTQSTTPWIVDGSGVTQPVSATSLPLPTGASTAAKQDTGNTSLASIDSKLTSPITVTGTVTANAGTGTFLVDGSAHTQPVSAVALPLPTGASTSALQTTGNTSLSSIDSKTPALGQATMANSSPVVIASNQSAVPISGTVTIGAGSAVIGHVITDTGSVTSATQSGSWAVTANAGTNLNTSALALDSTVAKDASLTTINTSINTLLKPANTLAAVTTLGTITNPLPAGTNVIGHVITDTGSTTTVTGNVTVVQPTGTNLHTVIDSGTITAVTGITNPVTVIQPTGTNLHTVIDSGTLTSVTTLGTITNALPTGSNNIGSLTNITGTISLPTLAATSTKQSDGTQKTQVVDGSGNVIASTSNSLNVAITQALPAGTNRIGTVINSPIDGLKATYSSAFTGIAVASTSATDIFTITGSGTKLIRIIRIVLSGFQNTAGAIDTLLIKRSTANSGGTSTSGVAVPHDSTSAAATATTLSYTVNPSLGATVGTMRSRKIALLAKGSATATDPTVYEFGDGPEQAIILRGTGEVLAVNLNGQSLANNSFNAVFEWTEE